MGSAGFEYLAGAEPTLQLLSEIFPQPNSSFYTATSLAEGPDGSLYGATGESSPITSGTVYRVSRDGILTNFFTFNGTNGEGPLGGVTFGSDGSLYGVTRYGGSSYRCWQDGFGTVFKLTTNGALTTLFVFGGTNGSTPDAPLIKGKDGAFYGTTRTRGTNGLGTIFKITEAGILETVHSFRSEDNAYPQTSALVQGEDGSLFGTSIFGANSLNQDPWSNNGTIFKVDTNGALTVLFRFNGTNGGHPQGGLIFGTDGCLYGTADTGGAFDEGTVFKITTNGMLTTLFSFDGTNGARPEGPLTLGRDGWFYGTTAFHSLYSEQFGTNSSYGTVFRINTDGVLKTVASLDGTNGLHPLGGMMLSRDGNVYGVITDRMKKPSLDGNVGAVFRLVEPPNISVVDYSEHGLTLNWDSFENAVYRVEYRSWMPDAPWSTVADNVLSTSTNSSFLISPAEAAEGCYRVMLHP